MGDREVFSWALQQVIHTIRAPLRRQAFISSILKTVQIIVYFLRQ
jgi:hypothetical protein